MLIYSNTYIRIDNEILSFTSKAIKLNIVYNIYILCNEWKIVEYTIQDETSARKFHDHIVRLHR